MRCLTCQKLSFSPICVTCQTTFFTPQIFQQTLACGLKVISFYPYEEIELLLKSKYSAIGSRIYPLLARHAMRTFLENFDTGIPSLLVPVDDHTRHGYSHTALLAKHAGTANIKATYHQLHAKNVISYAGKNLQYRLLNSKNFTFTPNAITETILIDDLITSGSTLTQAYHAICKASEPPLFALTLASAKPL
jgi:competence protein ComFC